MDYLSLSRSFLLQLTTWGLNGHGTMGISPSEELWRVVESPWPPVSEETKNGAGEGFQSPQQSTEGCRNLENESVRICRAFEGIYAPLFSLGIMCFMLFIVLLMILDLEMVLVISLGFSIF